MHATSSEPRLLGRFDAPDIRARLAEVGVLRALEAKGFDSIDVTVDVTTHALPCALVSGSHGGTRHLLLEACVGELTVGTAFFARHDHPVDRPMSLVLAYWLREQDPTRPFSTDRPLLPLQRHPGLGVLRRTFHVIRGMAQELGRDGIASMPKFFHDALLFYRSRLFLFLDGSEQGRFEGLVRDLAGVALADASIALIAGCVRDDAGNVVSWSPGYQVFPISEPLLGYFNGATYAAHVAGALERSRFTCSLPLLAAARDSLDASWAP